MNIKVLIIHTAFIGDIVLSTPLIKKVKDIYPNSEIYYLTTPTCKTILENNPYLKDIIIYDKKNKDKGLKGFIKTVKSIRKHDFDIVITPHRYFRSSLLTLLSKAKIRIGYKTSVFSFVYNQKILHDKSKHEVERLLALVEPYNSCEYPINLYPSDKEKKKIDLLLKGKEDKKLILFAPGSVWKTKQWPINYFNEVIDHFKNDDNLVLGIVGGEKEKELDMHLGGNIIDFRGETTLLDFTELIRRCTIILGNDSSPIHIASAFKNVRIMGIFGPTTKELGFFPWSKNSIVFENDKLYCRPCSLHGGNTCPENHFKCMLDVKPILIIKEIERSLKILGEKTIESTNDTI